MSQHSSATAKAIRELARQHDVRYVGGETDALAGHITRLAGDEVAFDEIEWTLVALQRKGLLSRREMIRLQATYLREIR